MNDRPDDHRLAFLASWGALLALAALILLLDWAGAR